MKTKGWIKKAGPGSGTPGTVLPYEADMAMVGVISRRPLWGIIVFLAASTVAFLWGGQHLSAALPPVVVDILGDMPPVFLIDIVLVVSTISSLILIYDRVRKEAAPAGTAKLLFFPLGFYALYYAAHSLNHHFYAVFVAGLTICSFHLYEVCRYSSRMLESQNRNIRIEAKFGTR